MRCVCLCPRLCRGLVPLSTSIYLSIYAAADVHVATVPSMVACTATAYAWSLLHWSRSWQLDGCDSLDLRRATLDPAAVAALALALPASAVASLNLDAGLAPQLRADLARQLAGRSAGSTQVPSSLNQVPLSSMLSAMMLVDDVDYSRYLYRDGRLPRGRGAQRYGVSRIEASGCARDPYLLIDERELSSSASMVDAALACEPRRGAVVSLSVAPRATGRRDWLNSVLLPRMLRHNLSFDAISSAKLQRVSKCDSVYHCSGDGAPLCAA